MAKATVVKIEFNQKSIGMSKDQEIKNLKKKSKN